MGSGWKKWFVSEDYITDALTQLTGCGVKQIFILDSKTDSKYYLIVYLGVEYES